MNSKLYVGNMSFNTTEDALRDAFSQFGTVTDVYIANDRETGRPRGFAFVTFASEAESKTAIENKTPGRHEEGHGNGPGGQHDT